MTEALKIGLDSWIIQDGNYGDFRVGDTAAFAVEFYAPTPLKVRHPDTTREPGVTWLRDSTYAIEGRVEFVAASWWAINLGPIAVYNEYPIPKAGMGDMVRGEAYLGIDHFGYFERLSREPGAPPLIHSWRIEAIDLDATPWIENGPRALKRDDTRTEWRKISKTKAWKDDDGRASYVLTCARISDAPRLTLSSVKS